MDHRPTAGRSGPGLGEVRTDLALEAHAAVAGPGGTVPGVDYEEDRGLHATITRVRVRTPEAADRLGKAIGTYVTIDAPGLRNRNRELQEEMAAVLADELSHLMGLGPLDDVLVVGLGNWNATPDALGPKVVAGLLVTRHLKVYVPEELAGDVRGVAAISPGVLGLTGVETGEIVRGIVERIQPRAVICIDALAARSLSRIVTTIQVSDAGINPGAGVGNRRMGLTRETLGVPVYAIGVPTVVHAATIAHDAIEAVADRLRFRGPSFAGLAGLDPQERLQLVHEVLSQAVGELVVTPKEVDVLISDSARMIAGALNAALHPGISKEEISRYVD